MLLNTVALLLGVELILLYSGLGDGAITNFQCTDGPVCAGDSIECSCTTDTGTLEWFVKYSRVESLMWNQIPQVSFHAMNTEDKEFYGYNFTFNTTYTGLNTSILTFNLNHSESVLVECANGEVIHKMNTTVTDLGYYAKAPTNLTTTFDASGVTLQWDDTGNNCTSTVYQVTVISCSCTSTSVLMYSTSKTALHINSSDLLENVTYAYTVRGWNEQESNNSEPFTLAPVEVMSVTINITNATDPCKNNICCINVTLNIILESLNICFKHPNQYYSILYNPSTGHIPASFKINETEFGKSRLKFNETYCLVTPTKPIRDDGYDVQCSIGKTGLVILLVVSGILVCINIIICSILCKNKCKNNKKPSNKKSTDGTPLIEDEEKELEEKKLEEKNEKSN